MATKAENGVLPVADVSPADLRIRPYRAEDVDDVVSVWLEASHEATPFLTEAFIQQEQDNIRKLYLPNAETWVCEDGSGAVVGFVSLLGDEVGAIFVHPAAHGRGYGRSLMDQAISRRGSVHLDVFEDNAIGRRFYERYGFRFDHTHTHEETGFRLQRLTFDGRLSDSREAKT